MTGEVLPRQTASQFGVHVDRMCALQGHQPRPDLRAGAGPVRCLCSAKTYREYS